MPYKGHVDNGVVILDDPANLENGTRVMVVPVENSAGEAIRTPLRGTPYRFDDPFKPVVDESDWEAAR